MCLRSPFCPIESQLADCADYLVDLQDRLDVGELQRHLCVELRGSQHHSSTAVEKALRELTRGPLLSASELFTSYADPFDLHESKLLLLHFAGEVVGALFLWCSAVVPTTTF